MYFLFLSEIILFALCPKNIYSQPWENFFPAHVAKILWLGCFLVWLGLSGFLLPAFADYPRMELTHPS